MRYNPALDGLRAVAVVIVILHHSYFHTFPGGYIGVDLFLFSAAI
jgi:peptidoglycan/LPS O-acetylase OafA/YrhL